MEENTEITLQPGPYLLAGQALVVLEGAIEGDGSVCVFFGVSALHWSYRKASELTPMDHWPEWWPFQDAALPECTPQVGDWVRHKDWFSSTGPKLVIGNHAGMWQLSNGNGLASTHESLDGFTVVPVPEGVDQ